MLYRLAADLVVVVHLSFILFVLTGAFAVLRWPRLAVVHLPVAAWGTLVEFAGWHCPLTPLEVKLRVAAGGEGYAGGFVEHYLLPVIYPAGLTRDVEILLGAGVLVLNGCLYGLVLYRMRRRARAVVSEP